MAILKNWLALLARKLRSEKKSDEDRAALLKFTQNFYYGEALSVGEAQQLVENGVVELLCENGTHRGNGFLITENGYFITAAHCVAKDITNEKIRMHSGRVARISRVCIKDEKADIALAKAELEGLADAKLYRFMQTDTFSKSHKKPVVLLTRRNGSIVVRGGFTIETHETNDHGRELRTTLCDVEAVPGDSGGIVVTDGCIAGIMLAELGRKYPVKAAASWYEALSLILKYATN